MKFQKYTKYKASGVDWLGEIPEEWEVKRLKDILIKIGNGVTPKGGSEVYTNKGVPFLRSQNIYNDGLRLNNVSFISNELSKKMSFSLLKPSDILINITGASIGRTCIVPESLKVANINQHVSFLRSKKSTNSFYLSQYLKSNHAFEYIMSEQLGASKEAFNLGQISRIPFFYPKYNFIQTKIANYLDEKTNLIDKKISLLQKKKQKYKELQQTLINEVVTKGLDKNVKMKESEIEWIGEIPEHWEVKRLKDLGFLYGGLSGKKGDDFLNEDSILNKPFIPFTNIANNRYINVNDFKTVIINKGESHNLVKKNDLFFLMSSEGYEDIGKNSLLIEDVKELYLNSFCKGYRLVEKNINSIFLNYLLLSDIFRHLMIIGGKGFTRINLSIGKINNFSIIFPPKQEQIQIANYLDEKTKKIDDIMEKIDENIATLKEFRKTLINDAVTGKIKVA